MSAQSIEHLRRELRAKFPTAHACAVKEKPALQEFPSWSEGAMTELVCGGVGGSMALQWLLQCVGDRKVALVDGKNRFDPESYADGLCDSLLWIRLPCEEDFWKVADWVLKDGNMECVVLDGRGVSLLSKAPRGYWYRLRHYAESLGVAVMVLSSSALVPCAQRRCHIDFPFEIDDLERPREQLLKNEGMV